MAATCPIENLLKGELKDDMSDPWRCLLPKDEWPAQTPTSRVHATDEEWYEIVKAGYARGLMVEYWKTRFFGMTGGT